MNRFRWMLLCMLLALQSCDQGNPHNEKRPLLMYVVDIHPSISDSVLRTEAGEIAEEVRQRRDADVVVFLMSHFSTGPVLKGSAGGGLKRDEARKRFDSSLITRFCDTIRNRPERSAVEHRVFEGLVNVGGQFERLDSALRTNACRICIYTNGRDDTWWSTQRLTPRLIEALQSHLRTRWRNVPAFGNDPNVSVEVRGVCLPDSVDRRLVTRYVQMLQAILWPRINPTINPCVEVRR